MNEAERQEILRAYRAHSARFERLASARRGATAVASRTEAPAFARRRVEVSERQIEIVQLIAHGLSNDQIAQRRFLSPETVKTHVRRALSALGAANRAHAVATAFRAGLVS